ncbi:hypothetical protein KW548_06695 [Vibrio neptunius]|nr:hypothetical protein [Vibrio neptunius]QXX07654.1 hypothetical protein KW548_06695 [Vibrio neptunius]
MSEVAGKIANVLPIYPVRSGYANFFDTIMPAQAPPTLPDMASASGPIETEKLAFITQGFYESLSSKQERKKNSCGDGQFSFAQGSKATQWSRLLNERVRSLLHKRKAVQRVGCGLIVVW